ncbi:GNAT family N-acetyltransferase [Streptomyces sp. XM4193]|uniref:GNAT family N-acetyltransferase n=1 Tax=Streptomyces sp. XM4193 TaxID=2929782 RepID=UPI001FF9C285|nr:GNAT family N-acetyltransferase [Streptomyces sp. XM4193]MCK1794684.1 GNAT family N-acetyltransferase [Streptomyces sp. XM4193]
MELRQLNEELLQELLEAAVRDADPGEVMPPVGGPPGWTRRRREAFVRFHRERALAPDPVEATFAILHEHAVVGAARLERLPDEPGSVELGVWLGRSVRGRGMAHKVLLGLLEEARSLGFRHVVASTTTGNTAAQRALAALGADLTPVGATTVTAILLLVPADTSAVTTSARPPQVSGRDTGTGTGTGTGSTVAGPARREGGSHPYRTSAHRG